MVHAIVRSLLRVLRTPSPCRRDLLRAGGEPRSGWAISSSVRPGCLRGALCRPPGDGGGIRRYPRRRLVAPPPLRPMRSTDSSSVRAPSPTTGTHARAWDSSLTLNRFVLGLHEEAHVEVQVGSLAATGRNPVHVDVEDGVVERPHVESAFFARLAQRDRKGIGVSVAVTTGLQPAPELGVVRKEHAVARGVYEPCRAGDVADPAGTVETVGVRVDEGIEACDGRRLSRPSCAVSASLVACVMLAPLRLSRADRAPPFSRACSSVPSGAPARWRLRVGPAAPLSRGACGLAACISNDIANLPSGQVSDVVRAFGSKHAGRPPPAL